MSTAVSQSSKVSHYVLPLFVAAIGWLVLYRNEFRYIESQWSQDDFSYCYLVPMVAVYIVWQKRKAILASRDETSWPGFLGLLLSGAFLLIGRLGSLDTFIFLSVWLSIVSMALVFLGWKSAPKIAFPALVLLFIVPPPAIIERVLSFNLRLISSYLAAQTLQLMQIPVYLEGNMIDLGVMKLQVIDACSGLRYLLPTVFLSLIVGYMLNTRIWARLLLVALSAPIAIVLNIFRITTTGILVRYVSPTLAEGFFHDFQGWFIYIAAVALLAFASLMIRRFERPAAMPEAPSEGASGPGKTHSPGAGFKIAIIVAGLFIANSLMVSSVIETQTIPQWKSLDSFPLKIGDWTGTRSYLDKPTLESLWADDYFLASYQNQVTNSTLYLLVPYYKAQTAQHTAHAPTSCLLGSGWELTGRRILESTEDAERGFPVQQLVLSKNGEQLLTNFWFQQRGRIIANELANKFYLLYDALTMRRTDGALVRVEMHVPSGESIEHAQHSLNAFVADVEKHLRGHIQN